MGSLAQSIKEDTEHADLCDVGRLLEEVDNEDHEMIMSELGPNKVLSYPKLAKKINNFYPNFAMSRHKLGSHVNEYCKCFNESSTEDDQDV